MELTSSPAESIVNITQENAQTLLIDESFNRLVVADFWADWCEPCKQLMPVLEKLAHEYQGSFLLAKINADEQAMIAQQLRVQSLPTVMLIKDGQPVDGFAGVQPENAIREILEKYLPKPWEADVQTAQQMMQEGNWQDASSLLRQAYQEAGNNSMIGLLLAQCLIEINRLDDAAAIIETIPMVDQDAFYEQVKAALELKQEAGRSPEITALEAQLEANPDDLSVKLQLAIQLSQNHHAEEALEHLITILRKDKDFNNGEARKIMLDLFKTLGNKDPLVVNYQRQLFSLLY